MNGWIKLYTEFLDWEWHDQPEMVSLFVHLLLMAQWKDYKYRGTLIKRGQLITSRAKLSEITGLSERTIRTCLGKLRMTNEITTKSTNKFTLITICKYDYYQNKFEPTDQQNDQQNDQQETNQQIKNNKTNKIIVVDNTHAREQFFGDLFVQQMCMSLHTDTATYKTLADELLNDWQITEERDPSKKHFLAAMRIKVEAWRKRMSQPTKKTKEQLQAEAYEMAMRAEMERARRYGIDYN